MRHLTASVHSGSSLVGPICWAHVTLNLFWVDQTQSQVFYSLYIKALPKHKSTASTQERLAYVATHMDPISTSPSDAGIPVTLNMLRSKAPICRGIFVKKKYIKCGSSCYEQHEGHNSLERGQGLSTRAIKQLGWGQTKNQTEQKPWKCLAKISLLCCLTAFSRSACGYKPALCEINQSGKFAECTQVRGDGEIRYHTAVFC